MTNIIGGDIPALERLQAELRRRSQEIQALAQALNSNIEGVWWKGGASDRFRNAWSGEFRPSLQKLETALEDLGREVQQRKDGLMQVGN